MTADVEVVDEFDIDLRLGPWQSPTSLGGGNAGRGAAGEEPGLAGLLTEAECRAVPQTGEACGIEPTGEGCLPTSDSQPNCGCTNPNWCDTNTCELTCEGQTDTCGCPTVGGGATCDAPGCGEETVDTCGQDCEDQTGGDDTCDGCGSPSDGGATCVDCDMTASTCAVCWPGE